MEATQEERPLGVFVALGVKHCSIDIPPERFGYKMKPYGEDAREHDLVYYDPETHRPVSLRPVELQGGMPTRLYDARQVECLRKHWANQANGGTLFMEIPSEAMDFDPFAMGVEVPDGGVSEEDREDFAKLEELCKKQTLPGPGVTSLLDVADKLAHRYRAQNFMLPKRDMRLRSIQGRCMELLDALAALGVTPPGKEATSGEGRGNSGPGEAGG